MSSRLLGIVGLFKDPYHLLRAAKEAQTRAFVHCDAFTPYPVHGVDKLLNHKRSWIPWVTLVAGLTGCFGGLGFQIWVSAIDWPINIAGKPFLSIPAFIPITFECTVLFAGLATAATLIAVCKLPNSKPTILDPSLTNDKFALFVSAEDPSYRESEFTDLMKRAGAHKVRVV